MILTSIFLCFQYIEYSYAEFSISDSVFGSIFYITTGLHGLHIVASLILLIIATIRIARDSVTSEHSLILDFS